MSGFEFGLGWTPDLPDFRDLTLSSTTVKDILTKASLKFNPLAAALPKALAQPTKADLRQWCSPVEDQGQIGSCTANAGAGMLEYFQRRAFGIHLDASRLFLYKVTRNLLQWKGDTGAYLRTVMKAMAGFGVCPEQYWPYSDAKTGSGAPSDPFEQEPNAFCYAFALNYKATNYYRLDPNGVTPAEVLNRVKKNLAAGLPSMFGFTVYNSISQASKGGKIPFPKAGDAVIGGHAVMTVGYDDSLVIQNGTVAKSTKGALIIRNSWGSGWGDGGYGYLPYEYLLQGLAKDFWSVIQADFFNTNNFN